MSNTLAVPFDEASGSLLGEGSATWGRLILKEFEKHAVNVPKPFDELDLGNLPSWMAVVVAAIAAGFAVAAFAREQKRDRLAAALRQQEQAGKFSAWIEMREKKWVCTDRQPVIWSMDDEAMAREPNPIDITTRELFGKREPEPLGTVGSGSYLRIRNASDLPISNVVVSSLRSLDKKSNETAETAADVLRKVDALPEGGINVEETRRTLRQIIARHTVVPGKVVGAQVELQVVAPGETRTVCFSRKVRSFEVVLTFQDSQGAYWKREEGILSPNPDKSQPAWVI